MTVTDPQWLRAMAKSGGVVILAIVIDQLTKTVASSYFHQPVTLNAVGAISLPWLGAQPQGWLWGGGVILAGLILWAVHQLRQAPDQWLGWGLLWGGGVSNWLDRWQWQGVRDWLIIPGVGLKNNLADYAVTIGVILLIKQLLMSKNHLDQSKSL